eukprot:scaffold37195_cov19-Tisochrysis_lutea.AAC.1
MRGKSEGECHEQPAAKHCHSPVVGRKRAAAAKEDPGQNDASNGGCGNKGRSEANGWHEVGCGSKE